MTFPPLHRGPVRPTQDSRLAFQPATAGVITGGFWAERRQVNRQVAVPSVWQRLREAGNLVNLELAAGLTTAGYVDAVPFADSDVYKWLETVGWTLAHGGPGDEFAVRRRDQIERCITLLSQAQREDGYLHSYCQIRFPGTRFERLRWGHELYCAGHLIQAAIALRRGSGDARLLTVARRFADLIVRSFGREQGHIDGIDGHPEIETALVELYRETGDRSYLDGARYFIDRRGHGLLGPDRFGPQYWQDHVPVREATSVEGHAVRQLYLLAGVADVYAETGDDSLRRAAERLWQDMVSTRTYLTGGVGTHHRDEAFGSPYELTNDRSHGETCGAVASIMFSFRMLLITGEARYADLIERTLYNGFLAGLSLDGQRFLYVNPLQIREGYVCQGSPHDYTRRPWFRSACCPPNLMRTLASLEHYVLVSNSDEIRLHQYMSGRFRARVRAGEAVLHVDTGYPWHGRIRVLVAAAPGGAWGLTLRVPHWADGFTVAVNGKRVPAAHDDGWLRLERQWQPDDEIVLELPLTPRFTRADPRVDADRGLVAVERGPLVYCVESADQPGHRLDDVVIDTHRQPTHADPIAGLGGIAVLRLEAERRRRNPTSWWPYLGPSSSPESAGGRVTLTAIPYYAWGNREQGAMRVWLRTQ
jgi:DUF1680 family protein